MEQNTYSGNNIVLCGGSIDFRNFPLGINKSLSMVPVNGKPIIGWILDDLLSKGLRQATVVINESDEHFYNFLTRVYAPRMDITCARLNRAGSILDSLTAGLEARDSNGEVRVILGDTLIRDSYDSNRDFVYVGTVEESRRWCIAQIDPEGQIISYEDKVEGIPAKYPALAGYYHFKNGSDLRQALSSTMQAGERELSGVLKRYGNKHPIYARTASQWFDFGHLDTLVEARRRLIQPRYFNLLEVNPVLNTITKTSDHAAKLRDELDWFLEIPDELKILTPRIISHRHINGKLRIVQEYYGYPTLAELYVYSDLRAEVWHSVLRQVMRIHKEFCRFPGELPKAAAYSMYFEKTHERLDAWAKQSEKGARLLSAQTLILNGQKLSGVPKLLPVLQSRVKDLHKNDEGCVIHGDFCFSNILFDVNNQILRLIDPRGSFCGKGIYGDPRYDIAKLRHSASGLYDFIVADMFDVKEDGESFETKIFSDGIHSKVASNLDQLITHSGYSLEEIRLIEALLFISMVPLHGDHPRRQLQMFLHGLKQLNQIL